MRAYSLMDTKKVYDSNAHKWLRMEASSLSDFTARPFVFDACGELKGRSVLDIGCGEGYCARELKRRGAGEYLAVDLSSNMIEAAKARELIDQYGIEYLAENIVRFKPQREFDLCIAVFLFNYLTVEEMQQVFLMVFNALSTGGVFIFSVPHPFFPFINQQRQPPFYFEGEGKNYFTDVNQQFEGEIWKSNGEALHVQCVHKTVADYFNSLRLAGFTNMPALTELTVTPDLVSQNKAFFEPLLHQPLHMLFKVSK